MPPPRLPRPVQPPPRRPMPAEPEGSTDKGVGLSVYKGLIRAALDDRGRPATGADVRIVEEVKRLWRDLLYA